MSIARPASRARTARSPRPFAALATLVTLVCLLALQAGGVASAATAAERPAASPTGPLAAWPTGAAEAADTADTADAGVRPRLAGGDPVFSDTGYTCVVVVNLRVGGEYFGLLPGSCTEDFPYWFADTGRTVPVGPTTASQFPTHGLFAYENPDIPVERTEGCGGVITSVGNPNVGQAVTQGGITTGCQSGTVTGVNVTVNFGGFIVSGLIQTNLCAEPGGAALTSGGTLLGIPIGGTGNCSSGGSSYYQPVTKVLNEYGATIV